MKHRSKKSPWPPKKATPDDTFFLRRVVFMLAAVASASLGRSGVLSPSDVAVVATCPPPSESDGPVDVRYLTVPSAGREAAMRSHLAASGISSPTRSIGFSLRQNTSNTTSPLAAGARQVLEDSSQCQALKQTRDATAQPERVRSCEGEGAWPECCVRRGALGDKGPCLHLDAYNAEEMQRSYKVCSNNAGHTLALVRLFREVARAAAPPSCKRGLVLVLEDDSRLRDGWRATWETAVRRRPLGAWDLLKLTGKARSSYEDWQYNPTTAAPSYEAWQGKVQNDTGGVWGDVRGMLVDNHGRRVWPKPERWRSAAYWGLAALAVHSDNASRVADAIEGVMYCDDMEQPCDHDADFAVWIAHMFGRIDVAVSDDELAYPADIDTSIGRKMSRMQRHAA